MFNFYKYRDDVRVGLALFAEDAVDRGQTRRKQTSSIYSTCNTAKFISAQQDEVKL